jgi:hypothetical protein
MEKGKRRKEKREKRGGEKKRHDFVDIIIPFFIFLKKENI